MFAEVILSKVSSKIDRIYDYSIPKNLKDKIQVGSQVLIPFGHRKEIGYVVGITPKAEVKKVKDIIGVTSETPLFTRDSVDLAKWLSSYYFSFFITSLRAVMPPGMIREERRIQRAGRRKQLKPSLKEEAAGEPAVKIAEPLPPTEDQKKALVEIKESIDKNKSETILLYGITGSGKTEVYLQAIGYALKQGKSSIVLVPEIAMTPQMIERFRDRFRDHMAILHSDMTVKERGEEWIRLSAHGASIVLGTRSAIFAPVANLGLIVIDEEYEITYKQEMNPKYHARTVAEYLAKRNRATLLLGSATPSIETFYKAKTGEYKLCILGNRIDNRPLPPVEVIDMRKEVAAGNTHVLSRTLRDEIKNSLSRGEQIILFINRRGYFTFVICRECGYTIKCPKCEVPLIFHSGEKRLRCSRCNFQTEAPIICPHCQSSKVGYFGQGTQRIEEEVGEIFPEARILRVDRDTMRKRGSHEVIFAAFKEGKANVLIGTQMVTKGLDVAKVTLVGVVAADTAINLPDFRAGEHTFQLLTQVAGRAGRHHLPGKVIIQTYNPEHYAIKFAATHNYEGFYNEEIKAREELFYPPYSKLINILIHGRDEGKIIKVAEALEKFLGRRIKGGDKILGPAKAPLSKIRGEFRWHMLLKGENLDKLRSLLEAVSQKVVILSGVRVSLDVEPMNML